MSAYERARAAWPTLTVSPEAFAAHLARGGAGDKHASDLFVACACAAGDPTAIVLFDQHYIAPVPRWVAHIEGAVEIVDEVKQRVRDYLFVAKKGASPHIADYCGSGPLAGWVRIIALRCVLQMKRSQKRNGDSDANTAARLAACEPSAEVALIRTRHGAELAEALRTAIAGLPDKERGLLKLAVIDELTIDELAMLYAIHRATAARWVSRLKQQIFDAAVTLLRKRLDLDTAGVESLCRAVRSQLDFSLGSLLD